MSDRHAARPLRRSLPGRGKRPTRKALMLAGIGAALSGCVFYPPPGHGGGNHGYGPPAHAYAPPYAHRGGWYGGH